MYTWCIQYYSACIHGVDIIRMFQSVGDELSTLLDTSLLPDLTLASFTSFSASPLVSGAFVLDVLAGVTGGIVAACSSRERQTFAQL